MEKLVEFIKFKGFSASRFAEMLGVKPAGISHILNGRNKPSYDLICRILQVFPELNPYWLLGDSERMLNPDTPVVPGEPTLPGVENVASVASDDLTLPFVSDVENPAPAEQGKTSRQPHTLPNAGANVARIIVVYDDRTFEAFEPR